MGKMSKDEKRIWIREMLATFIAVFICSVFVKKVFHGSFMWIDSLQLAGTLGIGIPLATIGMRKLFHRNRK